MLLIPSSGHAGHGLAALALSHRSLLIGQGPLPGSLVVFGDRAALLPSMLGRGILVVAAPRAGCGASVGVEAGAGDDA